MAKNQSTPSRTLAPVDKLAFSLAETARLIGVCPRMIQRMAAEKTLHTVNVGRRRLIARAALEDFLTR
jgi:excisionase family DNA binding protein